MAMMTKEQVYMAKIAGHDVDIPKPITKDQAYLAFMAGASIDPLPNPTTKEQALMKEIAENSAEDDSEDEDVQV